MDSDSSGRYLFQGEGNSCLTSIAIEPSEYVVELEKVPYQVQNQMVILILAMIAFPINEKINKFKFLIEYKLISIMINNYVNNIFPRVGINKITIIL